MTPPPPQPQTLLGVLTQTVQTVANVNFSKLALKPKARVPKLEVQDAGTTPEEYVLLGDRYILGRSSKSCDIVVRNPVISQIHLSLLRDPKQRHRFRLKDENSTNGIYRGRRRIQTATLRHNDRFTLGPPELAAAVQLRYLDPPPWYIKAIRYAAYGIGGFSALIALIVGYEWTQIPMERIGLDSVPGPVIIMARDGETPLKTPRNTAHLELKQLSEFSKFLPKAVIASEDTRYNWHLGVDPIGILRAVVTNVRGGELREGASTITQQVARSLYRDYVGTEDSAGRKLKEMIVALKLEAFYSKDKILLTYLNRVYLGTGNYGFEDAAQFYLGKSAKDLSLAEAATLVGILPAPNRFNPIRDYPSAIDYRDRVLKRMAALGMVSQEDARRAIRSRIEINPKAKEELESRNTLAPYFYSYVFDELETVVGRENVTAGNWIVESTVDLSTQAIAETSLRNAVANRGEDYGFSQGAIVTLNAKTGEVLALVGGADYQQSQFNRATQAQRQPGSTFKIFTYTAALQQGISPGSAYPCGFFSWGGQSFEGCASGGSFDLYSAVAFSANTVALRVAQDVGLNKVAQLARQMGIQSKLNPVPGLVLGQSEVTPLEMTGAVAVLANQGVRQQPHAIRRVLDSSDCKDFKNPKTCREVYNYAQSMGGGTAVVSPEIADTMTTLLRGVIERGTGRSAYLGLGEVGKTGTTNSGVDLWFVGYVPSRDLVTSVWLGNDNNSPTSGSSDEAARLWGQYMGRVVR